MKLTQRYQLATFVLESGITDQSDVFGTNGLPLTPASIKMVGNFHSFVASNNASRKPSPHLTTYLDCIRSKNEKNTLVFEHYSNDVGKKASLFANVEALAECGLRALHHIHYTIGGVHGLVTPAAFLYADHRDTCGGGSGKFKLAHWAINLITDCGELCQSTIFPDDIRFLPIEQLLMSNPTRKSDVWSLALSLLYFMFPARQNRLPTDPFELAKCADTNEIFSKLGIAKSDLPSEKWYRFFVATLQPRPEKRFSVKDLLQILQIDTGADVIDESGDDVSIALHHFMRSNNELQSSTITTSTTTNDNVEFDHSATPIDADRQQQQQQQSEITRYLNIHEFYYLWCITFPTKDADKTQKKKLPPILSIPRLILLENVAESGGAASTRERDRYSENSLEFGMSRLALESVDTKDIRVIRLPAHKNFKLLPMETINERLLKLPDRHYTPIIFCSDIFDDDQAENEDNQDGVDQEGRKLNKSKMNDPNLLPVPIRETDFDYQCERLLVFKMLINGFPFVREQLIAQATTDICPHYRAQIWSSLLDVGWSDRLQYERIDKLSATTTDRQIAVDIPRCHQYNDLLASNEGHRKLTRILKAWLAHNESSGEVYWQGLDSLAAPFLILNFNNEPQAFACFHRFIKKYLYGFFQKDNSSSIQEYLTLFQIVSTFHDPAMSNHFAELGFVPDLYAISWFLTMFTHILPLYQVVQLWDTLILGNDSFPLFIGLAILHQLRDKILDFTFNDCILIFSDLPQIDIDRCVRNSVKFFRSTPKSITKRGRWPLAALKKHPRLPRIDIDDLLEMIEKSNEIGNNAENTISSQFIFVDCRPKEQIATFGAIIGAYEFDDYCNRLVSGSQESQCSKGTQNRTKANQQQQQQELSKQQQSSHCKHHLVIVVNSIEKSMQLIERFLVPRLCYLELNATIPKQLLLV